MRLADVPLALALAAALGCSTTYRPRPDRRVEIVLRHGAPYYLTNGELKPAGVFGSGLEKVVADTPEATQLARRATHELAVGAPAYLAGIAAIGVGLLAVSGRTRWPLVGAGVAVGGAGLFLLGAGVTNAIDAVNVHNDAIGAAPAEATASGP